MSWLINFVKPKIQALIKRNTPDNLWEQCPSCEKMLFHRDLLTRKRVCEHCDYHFSLGAKERAELIFDVYEKIVLTKKNIIDPLKFKDSKKYSDRLKEYRKKTGDNDAFHVFLGKVAERPLVMGVLNFGFMGGSMGSAVGNGFHEATLLAIEKNAPLLVVTASGGARMQEGIFSLMQMPRTIACIQLLKEKKIPYIVLLTNPTTGGVSASFAMLGDIHIAEPKAMIGFAGARVIQETIRQKLPEGFQTAEYLQEHGMVDLVVHRHQLKEKIGDILSCLPMY